MNDIPMPLGSFFTSKSKKALLTKVNILNSRDVIPLYGDLPTAMAKLGYQVNTIEIPYEAKASLEDNKQEKIDRLSLLHHSLKDGFVKHVPDFLDELVKYYKQALVEHEVHGIFIPPTGCGVLFSSMVKHLDSGYSSMQTAERGYDELVEEKYNKLLKEVSIILAARVLNIPVLGSCHGAQLLWYMHGGELYSLPRYSNYKPEQFYIQHGEIKNPNHIYRSRFETILQTSPIEEDGYESDPDEEETKDYDHNLLMIGSQKQMDAYHAKPHPLMLIDSFFSLPKHHVVPAREAELPPGQIVAKSFEHPGCIALQWHPHRDINSKSAIHYLHQFGRQCADYKDSHTSRPCNIL